MPWGGLSASDGEIAHSGGTNRVESDHVRLILISGVTEIAQTRNWRKPLTLPYQDWGLSLRLLKGRGRSRTQSETRPKCRTDRPLRLVPCFPKHSVAEKFG